MRSFLNTFLLSLCCLSVHLTEQRTKWREERDRWDASISSSLFFFSCSLHRFTLHFNSCQRSILSRWEFTIWHPGFWGSIKYIYKKYIYIYSLTNHRYTGCHVAFVNLLHVLHVFFFKLILPFYWFIKSQSTQLCVWNVSGGIKMVLKEVSVLFRHERSLGWELEGKYEEGRKQHINI